MNLTELAGHISGGVIILDQPVELAEGTRVRVLAECEAATYQPRESSNESVGEMLMTLAGTVDDLPPDAAEQHCA